MSSLREQESPPSHLSKDRGLAARPLQSLKLPSIPSSPESLSDSNQEAQDNPRPAPSPMGLTLAEPKKKRRKCTKSYSQKQREELMDLRVQVEELEATIETLTLKNQRRQVTPNNTMSTTGSDKLSIWECIAKRQRGEKAKSEVENAKLRDMVKSQLQLVKRFERLIHKSRSCGRLRATNSVYDAHPQHSSQLLEEMLLDVNSRYAFVDTILLEGGLSDTNPTVNIGDDATLKYSPAEGMHLEFKEKRFMPFNVRAVEKVVWKSLPQGKLKLIGSNLVLLKHTKDTLISTITLPLPMKNESNEVTNAELVSVMKRFQQQSRIVYVWCAKMSVFHPDDGRSSHSLITFEGCSTATPATLPDGTSGCLVRSHTKSIPNVSSGPLDEALDRERYHELGVLTEMVFAAFKQSRQDLNQALENLLLTTQSCEHQEQKLSPAADAQWSAIQSTV